MTARDGRLRGALAATLGLAVLATGCSTTPAPAPHGDAPITGPGPSGTPSAAPAQLVPSGSPAPRQGSRPNVVEIVTDDMRVDDLRFMPNVRRLVADRGLQFRNSFAPNPLCAPARSSLLTGNLSHRTGVTSVVPPYAFSAFDDSTGLATAMNRAGYNTVLLGKYLNGYGDHDARATGEGSFRYVPPGWTEWWGSTEPPPGSGITGGSYRYFHVLLNHDGTVRDDYKGQYQTDVEGRIASRMVEKYHRSPKPFFLYLAPIAPHVGGPRERDDPTGVVWPGTGKKERFMTPARPKRVRGRFDGQVTRPPGLPLSGRDGPAQQRGLPRPMRWLPPISSAERAAMLAVTRQRAEALSVLDDRVGDLVATLRRTGELADTVIAFTSDNGYFLGEHRMRQGKIWTHEPSLRVPFLVAGPGIPHGVRDDPVTSADIAATVMDLGGASPSRPVDGVSVVPSFARDRGWRRAVLLENRLGDRVVQRAVADAPAWWPRGITGSGIRTSRYTYVRYIDGDAELYDLDRDPNELHNLYGRPRYATVQAALARVWAQRRNCRGAACHAAMPASLQAGPDRLHASTQRQRRGVEARYGEPAL